MRQLALLLALLALPVVLLPAGAFGHAERPTSFPDHTLGAVPKNRSSGPSIVVCKRDSKRRIRALPAGRMKRKNRQLLKRCRFRHIQRAVDRARNGTRILVLPGVYREQPSRRVPVENAPGCEGMTERAEGGQTVPSYEYDLNCPTSRNLIAVMGDGGDADKRCDRKCNIEIEGQARRGDVLIQGDRRKLNVIRADRADGIYLANFTIEYSDFNNVYALETNGFAFRNIESRYSREYGFLSFTSDNGLYENLEAYGSGDSGIYPGSGPEGGCQRYGIEITRVDSHHNTIGYSGTAGNGIYAHGNRFHHNAAGMTTDSFASGHPGMPQDCSRWERNEIHSNNEDYFNAERDEYCKRPYLERDPTVVCPTFQVPVGTGLLIAGGNSNQFRDNHVWDNWRSGVRLMYVPAAARGDGNPANQADTSHFNVFENNRMGVTPDGQRDPNGQDFWWDEEGRGNCWQGNVGPPEGLKSDPPALPGCPNNNPPILTTTPKTISQVPCATWDPETNTDPTGCDWFTRPPEPQ